MKIFEREPGPWLRPLKDYLLGLVIDGQLAPDDRDEATRLATAFVEEQEQPPSERAGEDEIRGQTGQLSASPRSNGPVKKKGE
jgi:poly(A) polymerase